MLAFHNSRAVKEYYTQRVQAHALADELVQGIYWQDGKGCGVGCTIHSGIHHNYESELGIPTYIAFLEDCLFEHMTPNDARMWPSAFLASIPVGADLTDVWPRFAIWLIEGVMPFLQSEEQNKLAQRAIAFFIRGETPFAFGHGMRRQHRVISSYAFALADDYDDCHPTTRKNQAALYAIAYAVKAQDLSFYASSATSSAAGCHPDRYSFALCASEHLQALLRSAPVPPTPTPVEAPTASLLGEVCSLAL